MQVTLIQKTTIRFNSKVLGLLIDRIIQKLSQQKKLKNRSRLQRQEITLVLVSSRQMKQLNQQFRQKNYATDILSFNPVSKESMGELVLCPAVLKKQAISHKHSLGHEMVYMLLHGVLHLLGYDHEQSTLQEKKMFLLQDRLFSQLTRNKINLKI